MAVRLTACFITGREFPSCRRALTASRRIAMIPRSASGHPDGGEGSTMTRRAWRFGRRRGVLCLILLVGASALLIARGAAPTAWAAEPTVHYISHRFPMLEFWVKKMGEYPGIKLEAELIPFDQALEKMQIHLSQGASTYDIM